MRAFIKVDAKLRTKLMKIYGLSRVSVWKALNGLTNTERSFEIRSYALAHGGKMVREDYMPQCKTVLSAYGTFYLEFAGGIRVSLDPVLRVSTITRNGEELERFEEMTLFTWENVLRMAQAYADGNFDNISN